MRILLILPGDGVALVTCRYCDIMATFVQWRKMLQRKHVTVKALPEVDFFLIIFNRVAHKDVWFGARYFSPHSAVNNKRLIFQGPQSGDGLQSFYFLVVSRDALNIIMLTACDRAHAY